MAEVGLGLLKNKEMSRDASYSIFSKDDNGTPQEHN